MSLESFGDAGVVGVVALFILKEVFAFVKSHKKGTEGVECDDALAKLSSVEDSLSALVTSSHNMVAVIEKCDPSGLPLVYRDGSLTDAIKTLNSTINTLASKVQSL